MCISSSVIVYREEDGVKGMHIFYFSVILFMTCIISVLKFRSFDCCDP
ncbi:unnamed protein product [Schistosoma margrebowiei]|uniref:Uncharacterized protein n=1 Tax=Schistosoma margrebowiei TaxID=48269 RepID=A0A183MNP1_9TREM|nr:unnamed protein product [Schistosoma margrebowiei]